MIIVPIWYAESVAKTDHGRWIESELGADMLHAYTVCAYVLGATVKDAKERIRRADARGERKTVMRAIDAELRRRNLSASPSASPSVPSVPSVVNPSPANQEP